MSIQSDQGLSDDWQLCGSRWYGDADEESDWDFVMEWNAESEARLLAAGFKETERDHPSKYLDQNTRRIFEKDNCHAIFTISWPLRMRAREIAKDLHKYERKQRAAWNGIYAVLKFIKP